MTFCGFRHGYITESAYGERSSRLSGRAGSIFCVILSAGCWDGCFNGSSEQQRKSMGRRVQTNERLAPERGTDDSAETAIMFSARLSLFVSPLLTLA